ncbi:MAG TPA: formyltransferase family protein [Dehalococcoidales bacterium]
MDIVCFISGSGTNYREIVKRNPTQRYLVFTNRPGCPGVAFARENHHAVIEFSHAPFLKEVRKKYGPGNIPRNCPERLTFEQEAVKQIENHLGKQPDLICLAGYDQWNTDWFVERYYPRILNVHPGDTTKGYAGLHWIPAAEAILAGEEDLRSTLFFVDKTIDDGPILVQSAPINIRDTLTVLESVKEPGLHEKLRRILDFAASNDIKKYDDLKTRDEKLFKELELICSYLQDSVKTAGDWKIYPFAVHDLISAGRVEVEEKNIYVDGRLLPIYGYRMETNRC